MCHVLRVVIAAVFIFAVLAAAGAAPDAQQRVDAKQQASARREKAAYLWQRVNPRSYSLALVDFFCTEYEQAGIGPEWWYSFCNWYYASEGLNPKMSCRDGKLWARGLADCTQRNAPPSAFADIGGVDFFDPFFSIRNDRFETAKFHRQTRREGWSLRRKVFLPASPDGRRAMREQRRWERVARKMERELAAGYRAGKLTREGDGQ